MVLRLYRWCEGQCWVRTDRLSDQTTAATTVWVLGSTEGSGDRDRAMRSSLEERRRRCRSNSVNQGGVQTVRIEVLSPSTNFSVRGTTCLVRNTASPRESKSVEQRLEYQVLSRGTARAQLLPRQPSCSRGSPAAPVASATEGADGRAAVYAPNCRSRPNQTHAKNRASNCDGELKSIGTKPARFS